MGSVQIKGFQNIFSSTIETVNHLELDFTARQWGWVRGGGNGQRERPLQQRSAALVYTGILYTALADRSLKMVDYLNLYLAL